MTRPLTESQLEGFEAHARDASSVVGVSPDMLRELVRGYRAGIQAVEARAEKPGATIAVRADVSCAVCGHAPESHAGGTRQCFSCSPDNRCIRWVAKSPEAAEANK